MNEETYSKISNLFEEITTCENEGYIFDKKNNELIKEFFDLIIKLNTMRKENNYIVKDKVNFKIGKGAYLNISSEDNYNIFNN